METEDYEMKETYTEALVEAKIETAITKYECAEYLSPSHRVSLD